MSERLITTLEIGGEQVDLLETAYADGAIAVTARTRAGEPYAVLSVNSGQPIAPGCFVAKTYSENEAFAAAAMASGAFTDTGLRVRVGMAAAPIWTIR
jgi:hypothetical protein